MIFYFYSVYFYLFYYLFYSINTVNFVKSYLFVECTSRDGERQNKDTKRYTLHTPTMTPSSSLVQCLYEYSNLSSFEVTSKESFLSTVNNGKALSMTTLYHTCTVFFGRWRFALLSLSVAVLRTTQSKNRRATV